MIDKITCKNRIGSDIDRYVIAVLCGLQNGIEPPKEISKEFYDEVKNHKDNYSDFLVGYIGYEMSFGAKWFGGYIKRDDKKHRGDIYSYKSCMKQAPKLADIEFKCCSFDDYNDLEGYVIYCDPPYRATTPYKQDVFPYNKFYDWCKEMSKKNTVLVSEYNMPDGFTCIWQKETVVSLDNVSKSCGKSNVRTERLFMA